MKKLLLLLLLFVSFTSIGQETKSFEETLTPYVEKILSGIEKGVEFAQDEIPIVVKQYLMYEAVYSWSLVLIGLILLFVLPIIFRKSTVIDEITEELDEQLRYDEKYKKLTNNKYLRVRNSDLSGAEVLYYVLPGFSIFVGLMVFFWNIWTAVLITFFPKLFLVKEFLNHI